MDQTQVWQDPHLASSQPWNYYAPASVMTGLNGHHPAPMPYHPQAYSVHAVPAPQFTSTPPFAANYDSRFYDPQRHLQPIPSYYAGHEGKVFPGGSHAYQPYAAAMMQKQHAFTTANIYPTPPFNGTTAVYSAHGYTPRQMLNPDMHARQLQPLDVNRRPVPGASKPYTPASPAQFQPPHAAAPLSPQLPRGPPRKPKRSGHAIWVGNIPMGASIEALKDHFSKDATEDIESVFLMAKSNCAFVNYTTEKACLAAVERFNHSLFGSVRLLCRIRREPSTARSQSTGSPHRSPMPTESTVSSAASVDEKLDEVNESLTGLGISQNDEAAATDRSSSPQQQHPPIKTKPSDRYFVLKSLTKEDLQESLMKGTWETQSHNQQILHDAFFEAENVYLIFSVNKSGEYFGYARMVSSPFDSSAQQSNTSSPDTTPHNLKRTPATTTAPRGHIIDDPNRGILFWEAEHSTPSNIVSSDGVRPKEEPDDRGRARSRPFQVEWLSVRRVTFQRTKGMRNSWNANKEVKVARDGTELETEVARKVVGLFHERYEDGGRKG